MPELEDIVSLQIAVWGLNPRNAVPAAIQHVLALNGGLVLGAYDDQLLVGLLICMPAKRKGEWVLWSHMTGVLASHQGHGVGLELKRFQYRWALANDYKKVCWTMDPLQRGNARFNLHLLGMMSKQYIDTYHVDFYGEMDDDINRGMPSDRIEIVWALDQPSLHQPLSSKTVHLLKTDAENKPIPLPIPTVWDAPAYRIAVPRGLDEMRQTNKPLALEWRLALREIMLTAIENGYTGVDFIDDEHGSTYVMRRIGGNE